MPDDDLPNDPLDELVRDLPVATPSAQFADRVLEVKQRRHARARVAGAVSALAAVALAACALLMVSRGGQSADVVAEGRESVDIGGHVIAVLEPAARLKYDLKTRAVFADLVDVDQPAGRVFYRVDKGTPLTVHTPAGDVVVHGTCFVVDVAAPPSSENHNMSNLAARPNFTSAFVGALAGAVITVAVFEGAVHVENKSGDVAVVAGEVAEARADRAPVVKSAGSVDAPAARRLRAENEGLLASLDNARAAAGGDLQKVLAENQALREKLKHDDEELALNDKDRSEKEGKERPFPKDLPARFTQAQLLSSFTSALKSAGVDGDVTHIDCDEFPCIVYGDVKLGKNGDAGALANKLKESPALAPYQDDEDNNSWWRSLKTDPKTGETVDDTHFGIAVWPKDSGDHGEHGDQSDDIAKRVGFRNQQMWDAMKPAKR